MLLIGVAHFFDRLNFCSVEAGRVEFLRKQMFYCHLSPYSEGLVQSSLTTVAAVVYIWCGGENYSDTTLSPQNNGNF